MKCPNCGSIDDKVMESRQLNDGSSIRRRRECLVCGSRFTSYERIEEKPLYIVKSSKRREPFDREKIERGIRRAVEKRPVSQTQIESIVNSIEDRANQTAGLSREIDSSALGDMVLRELALVDDIAYIRFASVYRRFSNIREFMQTIEEMKKQVSGEGT